jgi:hypothetical protein
MRSEEQRGCRRRGNDVDHWSDSSKSCAGWTGTMTTNYSEQISRLLCNTFNRHDDPRNEDYGS